MFVASATVLTLACSLGFPTQGNSLGTDASYQDCLEWLNIATVWLCGICLIALLVALYRNIYATSLVKRSIEKRFDTLMKDLAMPDVVVSADGVGRVVSAAGGARFFLFFEWVAYLSFVLMVVGLVVRYGILAAIYPVLP